MWRGAARDCRSGHVLKEQLKGEWNMLDLIFVAVTVIFFLIALAYVRGCERLQ
jgi:hypothetical protein